MQANSTALCFCSRFKDHFRIKYSVPLMDMWVSHTVKKSARARTSLILGWADLCFVVSFHSVDRMEKWYTYLHSNIYQAHLHNLPLDTILEDVEDHVCESEKDSQFSVNSRKKETTEPSMGCEHLHKPLTTTEGLPQEPGDSPSACCLQESFLVEQICKEPLGQFILKPRHPCRDQQERGEPHTSCICLLSGHVFLPKNKLLTLKVNSMGRSGNRTGRDPIDT
ncbi:rho GTPase-activating protein 20-like [Erinaceus europaeus]|uniref:Rho GTPase-activating protein 20-like n=1 Tax=Erinaceus europaeus TaxID=9365 RepID=A0ABM3X0Y0_ERIEU|nr:rho GTPase-activating protein 20-like [Erinaceus europaeus]